MSDVTLRDYAPPKQQFLSDVLEGLQSPQKSLPCKYLYDENGSQLFEQICELDEYYLTRTELEIMRECAQEITAQLGDRCVLVEYGSGSSLKTRTLLDHLDDPVAYVPVDISKEHLKRTATELADRYPKLAVKPVCADFTRPFEPPTIEVPGQRTIVYFPGSTIGNFDPFEAGELLENIVEVVGCDGGLLIGVDLHKPRAILEPAYNDQLGITQAFNLNLLTRINRELGADFQLDRFRHRAVYNDAETRVEMHLVSQADQTVELDDVEIEFERGESIHTENSYKYTLDQFRAIADKSGFTVEQVWRDKDSLFSVQYLEVSG
jgi:dimethylhistidine N-methyltransferase